MYTSSAQSTSIGFFFFFFFVVERMPLQMLFDSVPKPVLEEWSC